MQVISSFIPKNTIGKAVDLDEFVTVSLSTGASVYESVRKKLLQPFLWHSIAGSGTASFSIISNGQSCFHDVKEGDFLQIDVPGPGTKTGDGYDWVQVEKIQENVVTDAVKSIGLRLRASVNPLGDNEATAHFFKADATSTFILALYSKSVNLTYHGRNEVPNTSNDSLTDDLRNQLVSTGARLGLSALQWSALLKGLLDL